MMKHLTKLERWKYQLLLLIFLIASSSISLGQSIELDKELGAENAKIVEIQMGLSILIKK